MDEEQTQETQKTPKEETQTDQKSWLKEEAEEFAKQIDYEELPSLKLEPNAIVEIDIDFSVPFQKWSGEQSGKHVVKKIIPIMFGDVKMNWWLNVKNPVYSEIIEAGIAGQTKFKVLQTGTQADTKYVLVK